MNLNQILLALPGLNRKERETLRVALLTLAPLADHSNDATSGLYNALHTALKGALPFNAFKKTRAYVTWKRDADDILKFVVATWPEDTITNKNLRHGLLVFLWSLIYDDLTAQRRTASLSMMVFNMSRIPAIFDREFPGYRDSGLTNLILQRISKGENARPQKITA